MEQSNKEKSWIYRLKHLKIRKRSASNHTDDTSNAFERHSSNTGEGAPKSTSSLRRSLRKMHYRMKKWRNRSMRARTLSTSSLNSKPRVDVEPRTILPSTRDFPQLQRITNHNVPTYEIQSLAYCPWYWGPITKSEAEDKLVGEPDGSFLIRDSTSDRYIFAMSFKSVGQVMHCRIEDNQDGYSLFSHTGYKTMNELITDALRISKNDIYCYTKDSNSIMPNYPVRLIKPISRYNEVKSLKHLTRFVIRQIVNKNDIEKLPLPQTVKKYIQEDNIFI